MIVVKLAAAYTLETNKETYEQRLIFDPSYRAIPFGLGHFTAEHMANMEKEMEDSLRTSEQIADIFDDGILDEDLMEAENVIMSATVGDNIKNTDITIDDRLDGDLFDLEYIANIDPDDGEELTIDELFLSASQISGGEILATSIPIPKTYKAAMATHQAPHWQSATDFELNSLKEKKVYDIVRLPEGARAITAKIVYKVKPTPTGTIAKYKARVVARGFQQRKGIDFTEKFAPTARTESIRILLAICALLNWNTTQVDVYVAFLNGELHETVYVIPPPPVQLPKGHVWKLLKSLYGLKQSPRQWYEKLASKLTQMGFRTSFFDPCVFIHKIDQIIISVHVDDIRIYAATNLLVDKFKFELSQIFAITSEDPEALYLGIHIEQSKDSIKIHQAEYIRKKLQEYSLSNILSARTPCNHRTKLSKGKVTDTSPKQFQKEYLSKFGSLNYLPSMTRVDLAYAASLYGRFNANPKQAHLDAIIQAYAYAKGTATAGITYRKQQVPALLGYVDADWAGCPDTRRSTTGYIFTLAGGPISWSSTAQRVVAQSTCEAEYMALGDAVKEAVWIKNFINDLNVSIQFDSIPIHVDNEAAIRLSKNPEFHQRSKHIDLRHHFIREHVQDGTITIRWISGKDNPADMLTKALDPVKFEGICKLLGIYD